MEIKDFISNAISEIVAGIEKAADDLKNKGVLINPIVDLNGFVNTSETATRSGRKVQQIEMSIAVTIGDSVNSGGKIGLNVLGFGADLETGNNIQTNNSVSSIKFYIPIAFPVGG